MPGEYPTYKHSLPAGGLKLVADPHLPAAVVLLLLAVLLLPHLLPDLVEVAQRLLVVGREPQRLLDLPQPLAEVVLFAARVTMLARAHPRAI